jgi:hypothetical protein
MKHRYEKGFKSRHIFKMHQDFICEEVLYVSSNKHESGYKMEHKANKGKKHIGPLFADQQTLTDRRN